MALAIAHLHPYLHHPHTISEKFMIWAVAIIVAALAAFSAYHLVDTNTFELAPGRASDSVQVTELQPGPI